MKFVVLFCYYTFFLHVCLYSYRSAEEVKDIRNERDPHKIAELYALQGNLLTPEEIKVEIEGEGCIITTVKTENCAWILFVDFLCYTCGQWFTFYRTIKNSHTCIFCTQKYT